VANHSELFVDFSYLLHDYSMEIHKSKTVIGGNKFELIKFALFYPKIYLDKETLMGIVTAFDDTGELKGICNRLVMEKVFFHKSFGDFIGNINPAIAEVAERHLIPLGGAIDYAVKNKCGVLASYQYVEDIFNFSAVLGKDATEWIKKEQLKLEIVSYVLDRYLPNFEINKKNIDNFLKIKKKCGFLHEKIDQLANDLNGYKLTRKEKEIIVSQVEDGKAELMKIKGLGDGISTITSIPTDIVSLLTDEIPGVSTASTILNKLYQNRKIKSKKLEWIVYLLAISGLRGKAKSPPSEKCVLCSLSDAELKNMSESEAEKIIFSHDMCVDHMATYLTVRKAIAPGIMGKQALLLVRDYEDHYLGS
jgi:hypothetical protein